MIRACQESCLWVRTLILSDPLARIRNDAWLHLIAIGKAIDLFDVRHPVGSQKGDDALLLFTRLGIIIICIQRRGS